MNETILILIFIAILFGSQLLLRRIKRPLIHYIRFAMFITLILLAWWPDEDRKNYEAIFLTGLAIYGIWNEIIELRKLSSKSSH
jgi:hypothetical protein